MAFAASVEESQAARHAAFWQEQDQLLTAQENDRVTRYQEVKRLFQYQMLDLAKAQDQVRDSQEILRQGRARMPLIRTL
jgi:hypothetical protein